MRSRISKARKPSIEQLRQSPWTWRSGNGSGPVKPTLDFPNLYPTNFIADPENFDKAFKRDKWIEGYDENQGGERERAALHGGFDTRVVSGSMEGSVARGGICSERSIYDLN